MKLDLSNIKPIDSDKKSLLIAIDYDGTISEDIDLWVILIRLFEARGHRVVIVTMRTPSEKADIDDRVHKVCSWIIPTSRRAKKEFCAAFGVEPDLWIEDNPAAVYCHAADVCDHSISTEAVSAAVLRAAVQSGASLDIDEE